MENLSQEENEKPFRPTLRYLLIISGAAALVIGLAGILGLYFGITVITSIWPGDKPIALSAALTWGFFGLVLLIHARRPLSGIWQILAGAVLAFIAVSSALEFPLNLMGRHFLIENMINNAAASFTTGTLTSVSPVATFLFILAAVGLFQLTFTPGNFPGKRRERDVIGLSGLFCATFGFIFVMSYVYGVPFLYGSAIIPIAFTSALASIFVGVGLVVAAGPAAFPLIYFSGPSTRAQLLRFFIPLTIGIVILQNLISVVLLSTLQVHQAVELAVSLILFCIITSWVVKVVAGGVGQLIDLETEKRKLAEEDLVKKHAELSATYDQLTAVEEELRSNYDELSANQKVIQENEKRLNTIYNTVGDVIFQVAVEPDEQYRFTSVNAAFSKITGLPTDQVIGRKVNDIIPKSSLNMVLEKYRQAIEENVMVRWEETSSYPAGQLIGEVSVAPLFDHAGKCTHLIGSVHDITDRKNAEEALRKNHAELKIAYERLTIVEEELRQNYEELETGQQNLLESEQRYRSLFENMQEGLAYCRMLYDDQGQPVDFMYLAVNNSFDQIIGAGTVVGKPVTEVFPDIRRTFPQVFEIYGRVAKTGKPESFDLNFTPVKKWLHISAYSPAPEQFVAIFTDITGARQAQEQRESLIYELERKNAELERFTYTVSHDLKSPLITIRGFAGLVEEDIRRNDTEGVARDLKRIDAAAQKMETLLQDLLNLSRIGRIVNPPEKVPFTEIAHEAVELLNAPIKKREVNVTIDPDMPVISVDRGRIREVVTNLVENAIKFMDDQQHPEIHIGVQYDGGSPVFFVKDNGIGIDPRYHKRIFNLFEKLDPKKEGSGAGLAIVKRIVELHGGKIWVESEGEGSGSTFRFTLSHPVPGVTDTHNKTKEED
ncbi:ATP-binding protein [Methanoregula sp.]|uniref:ATP-binding protein n=1 Tax=Methanoregula sp. TaxID=2052170 RepID=UPI002CCA9BF4|nr:ATP-binding protein [Methanoregula sp.]HVP96776.1 ATP-binding protein [Methanoregula sp.]